MEPTTKLEEPVVDRHNESPGYRGTQYQRARKNLGPSFFTLSGGILRRDHRTANRIDSMLSRMISDSELTSYSQHVDKNLDLLHTHLQLDMILMVANDLESRKAADLFEDPDQV